MTKQVRRLGGEGHRVAPEGAGSSPAAPATLRKRKALHWRLRRLDRELAWFDAYKKRLPVVVTKAMLKADEERRRVRCELKCRQY